MARRLTFLLLLLLFCISQAKSPSSDSQNVEDLTTQVVKGPNRRLLLVLDCGVRCKERCSLHSRPKVCIRACGTCCARCRCVPPGTFGNRELCGRCYTDMRTHGGEPKCP